MLCAGRPHAVSRDMVHSQQDRLLRPCVGLERKSLPPPHLRACHSRAGHVEKLYPRQEFFSPGNANQGRSSVVVLSLEPLSHRCVVPVFQPRVRINDGLAKECPDDVPPVREPVVQTALSAKARRSQ